MSAKTKIYVVTGISFLVLFIAVVSVLTVNQISNKNYEIWSAFDYMNPLNPSNLSNTSMGQPDLIENHEDTLIVWRYTVESLARFKSAMADRSIYVSALMCDENGNIINQAGDTLIFEGGYPVSLDQYMSDEQKKTLYSVMSKYDYRPKITTSLDRHFQIWTEYRVNGEVSGYINNHMILVPLSMTLTILSEEIEQESVTFIFENQVEEDVQEFHSEFNNASLYVVGFGRGNPGLGQRDKKRMDECTLMAMELQLDAASGGSGLGTIDSIGSHFMYQGIYFFRVNGENFYYRMVAQAFPREIAMRELIPTYCFLFLTMLVLFGITSQTFVRAYNKQLSLDAAQRNLTQAIAHELKTPLSIIRSYSEGLKENINENKRDHYLNVIIDEIDYMDDMVLDMLALYKLESGISLDLQKHSLTQMTESVLTRYQDGIEAKEICVNVVAEEDCEILCDRKWIERVLSNFLSNGVRHTPEKGTIVITVAGDSGKAVFSIENSGQHIAEEILSSMDNVNSIWEAYFKEDPSRSDTTGTGLGLSIVKSVLTTHDFPFGAENTERGVRFWFEAGNS
jgi:signal transduction histidine kinase